MKFRDEYHETLFWVIMQKMNCDDVYHQSVAYLIALDDVCRNHVEEIYDFDERCINLECIDKAWQTGTSRKTIHLAFNLWNGGIFENLKEWASKQFARALRIAGILHICEHEPTEWLTGQTAMNSIAVAMWAENHALNALSGSAS